MDKSDETFKKTLNDWDVEVPEDSSSFRRDVWRRIEADKGTGWDQFMNRLFDRPVLLAGIMAGLFLMSGIVATIRGSLFNRELWHELANRYVYSIDSEAMALTVAEWEE